MLKVALGKAGLEPGLCLPVLSLGTRWCGSDNYWLPENVQQEWAVLAALLRLQNF